MSNGVPMPLLDKSPLQAKSPAQSALKKSA